MDPQVNDNKTGESAETKSNLRNEGNVNELENTLEKDFADINFNAYLEHQPGASVLDDGRRCKIIIMGVSPKYSLRAIRNLCGEFGEVCSIVRGPQYRDKRPGYFFVTYGKLDEAQQAVEQINRMCKPMRAEFARSRQQFGNNLMRLSDENEKNDDEPVKIRFENRSFRGPFTEKYDFEFPTKKIGISLEDYTSSNLAKIDPTLNYFNETVLCDILTREEDVKDLESASQSHKLENYIWRYEITNEETAKIQKFLLASAGTYDEEYDIHSKRNEKFEKLSGKYGNCKVCSNFTTRVSKISEDFFCSTSCQQQQGEDHHTTTSSIEDIQLAINEFSRDVNVVITAVISQNTVYIRPSDSVTTTHQNRILHEVVEKCQDAPIIIKTPKAGEIIAVEIIDQIYYRAMVLKSGSYKEIRVALLDTGEVTVVTRAQLRKLPQNLMSLPIYVKKIVLTDVPVAYFNLEAVKYLTKLAFQKHELELLIKFDETLKTRLYQKDVCVNHELIKIMKIKEPQGKCYQIEDIPAVALKKLDSIQLVVLDNSMLLNGELSCMALEYLDKLEILHRKVQVYGNSLKLEDDHAYTPSRQEACLIRLNNVWYRAACFETVGDQHPTMQSVDYGFFSMVNISNIVKLPRKLLDNCYTYDFCIEDIDVSKAIIIRQHVEKAKEMLPIMKVITAEKITKKDDELFIQSKEIQEILEELNKLPITKASNETGIENSQNQPTVEEQSKDI